MWTPDHDNRLRALHAEGLSVRAIATHLDCSPSTISKRARLAGLAFDRAKVHAATTARIEDARARRTAALSDALDILQLSQAAILDVLKGRGTYLTRQRASTGAELFTEMNQFLPDDLRAYSLAVAAQARVVRDLDDTNSNPDHSAAASLLTGLADAFGLTPKTPA